MLSRREAALELRKCDHAFLSEKRVRELTEPFGFIGYTYLAKANPHEFKGLSLWDEQGNPIPEARGQDADIVAAEIVNSLGLTVPDFFGRGSRLAASCEIILGHEDDLDAWARS